MKVTGTSNSAAGHAKCGKTRMEYGVENGSFWYYCHECQKLVDKRDVFVVL